MSNLFNIELLKWFIKEKSSEFKWIAYIQFILFFILLWLWHFFNWQFFYQTDKLQHWILSYIISISIYLWSFYFYKHKLNILERELWINSRKFIILIIVLILWIIKELFDLYNRNVFEFIDLMFNYVWVATFFLVLDLTKYLGNKIHPKDESEEK